MPKKIVINTNFGGYSLSRTVKEKYKEATKNIIIAERNSYWHMDTHVARDDPLLIEIIESIGIGNASGNGAQLKIVEIPDDVPEWTIMEYDGNEWVAEKHRRWS